VYVVDEHLCPVPLGAPGEIVFSGSASAAGTSTTPSAPGQAYLTDPHRPGQRLYLGGDYGRWLPDGKLEFLGRRDSQVKISGFRIEIGEIENALLRVPGVRDAAVVVAERAGRSKHLVAFYTGPSGSLEAEPCGTRLGQVAARLHGAPVRSTGGNALPLTANGKIDTKIAGRAGRRTRPDGRRRRTPAGHPDRAAAGGAWAKVLGIPRDQIGRQDNFFDRGGTSLSAVKLAIATGPRGVPQGRHPAPGPRPTWPP
jgi:acyl-CoA synthetase (AMP-forming)/AMP-acid ligase II